MTKIKKKAIRVHEKYLEPHRQNKAVVSNIDKLMIIIGLMGSLATIIQVIHVYTSKNVGGLSVTTWILYLTVSLSWAAYGVFHRSKPLVYINSLALFTHSFIIAGFFLFK